MEENKIYFDQPLAEYLDIGASRRTTKEGKGYYVIAYCAITVI